MTGQHHGSHFLRHVAESVVDRAHTRSDAEQSVDKIRSWCDQTHARITEECVVNQVDDCDIHAYARLLVAQVRSLLPALPETPERRADAGEEASHDRDASDVPRRRGRPGALTDST